MKFDQIIEEVPELTRLGYNLKAVTFNPPIDSANMSISVWGKIANTIKQNYQNFDGFVVLHGTDTMAYTASALSFMFENLDKPVVFTKNNPSSLMVLNKLSVSHYHHFPKLKEIHSISLSSSLRL